MTRNTYVLIGIFLLLVGIAYLVMQKPGERSSSGSTGEYLVSIDSLAADKIEIKSPSANVVLEKKGVEWFLTQPLSYRADQAAVAGLIHDSKSLEVKNIVSNKPEKHSVFQVDSSGMRVTVFEKGAEKASFFIGKQGNSYTETYARRSNSNDVALVEGASSYAFNRSLKEWRDRTILSVPRENIKEVRFQYGDTTFVLAFKDSSWTIGKDSTLESAVTSLLASLTNVQADDFVDTLASSPPKPTAQVTYAGTQLTFFYVKEGDKYLLQSSGSPQRFEMQSWHANQYLKRKKELTKSGK